jgi:arsenate reductase
MIKQKVLFLCTGNSSRTQMAEGFLHKLAGDQFEVVSAGGSPEELSPAAIEAMREIGIDISQHRTKDVAKYLGERFAIAEKRRAVRFFQGLSTDCNGI